MKRRTVHTNPECDANQTQNDECHLKHFVSVPAISLRGTFKFSDVLSSQSLLNLHRVYVKL